MKCFYHPDTDAVGMCSQCGKGACRRCMEDVGGAMLCQGCLSLRSEQLRQDAADRAASDAQQAQQIIVAARRKITQAWIWGGVGAFFGFWLAGASIAASQANSSSAGPGTFSVLFSMMGMSVICFYVAWSMAWTLPIIWHWWRGLFQNIGCFLFTTPFGWIIFFVFFFYIPFAIAYTYGVFGGGIAQYLKHQRIVTGSSPQQH